MFRSVTVATALRSVGEILGGERRLRVGAARHKPAPQPEAMAVLGHELRTPLAALIGYAELLAGAETLSDAQRKEWSGCAREAALHLNALVGALIEGGAHGLATPSSQRQSIDARALAASCCDLVRPDASARGLDIVAPAVAEPAPILGDPRAIRQILLNLLANAIKFTPPGGEVRASVHMDDGMVILAVADTGVGMAASAARRSLSSGGLGLGLALVRSLAALHGGSVDIGPAGERGTLVRVLLPLHAEESLPADTTGRRPDAPPDDAHRMVACLA